MRPSIRRTVALLDLERAYALAGLSSVHLWKMETSDLRKLRRQLGLAHKWKHGRQIKAPR